MENRNPSSKPRKCGACRLSLISLRTGLFHKGYNLFIPSWAKVLSCILLLTFFTFIVSLFKSLNEVQRVVDYRLQVSNLSSNFSAQIQIPQKDAFAFNFTVWYLNNNEIITNTCQDLKFSIYNVLLGRSSDETLNLYFNCDPNPGMI